MNRADVIIKIVLSILLLVCLFDMPYGYFQLVRFLGMVGFVILAYGNYKKNQTLFTIWLASAILINPLFKVSLGSEIWNVVDVIWAIILISSIFKSK